MGSARSGPQSNQAGAGFGVQVATAGDVNGDGYSDVIVGAYAYDNGQADEGRAYVYLGTGTSSGLATTPAWMTESNQAVAYLGLSVSSAGDVNGDGYSDVIVGSHYYDTAGVVDAGRAFVYLGSSSGLAATAAWTADSDQGGASLGYSVSTAGDVNGDGYSDVIVGAFGYDNGQVNEGVAFVYLGSSSGLSTTPGWTGQSDQAEALYGVSVATAGDVNGDGYSDVIVGAYRFDTAATDGGRAFVYLGSASGLSLTYGWTAESNQVSAAFGYSVGTAGDVNGDGYADVIVGALQFDNGQSDEGRAFVYFGSAAGLSLTPSWMAESDQAGALFGGSVGTAGDVNGDGYADVIVGARYFDAGQTDEGGAFIWYGNSSGLGFDGTPANADWSAASNLADASFGGSVGTAGDVNGDGYADVIVGSSAQDRAFVYHGSASGLSSTANWTVGLAGSVFGISVGTAGDVNRDGYADVIVGAPISGGHAFVYHGSASGLSTTANWTAAGSQVNADFGATVGTAGDVNGDGYADVIVGAYLFDNGQTDEGRAFVYYGHESGLSPIPDWTAESDQASAYFGISLGTAGDVNGDGYADVIVGAYLFDNGQTNEGAAFVYRGSGSGLSPTADWMGESDQAGAQFGASVGTAGDVNGDGYADVIVGASGFDNIQSEEGRAFLYHGNGGRGLSLRPRQRRADDAAPIAPMGASESRDSFRLAALGRTPFGRGLVKLEWEVKPLGSPLDGTGIQAGTGWLDTGSAGAALNELVSGLTPGAVLHWRFRLRYHPAATPFQSRSRWLTAPWNGWQEGDLRTGALSDLAVSQTDGADPILFGSGNLTYTVSVTNLGPDGIPVALTDTLPAGTLFVGATPSQGTCAAPSGGVVTCALGPVVSGGGASVAVTVTPQAPGMFTNTAAVSLAIAGTDPATTNNVSSETTTVVPRAAGDRVWADTDGDGVQEPGEPGVGNVLVALYDGAGAFLDATVTDASGAYSLPNLTLGAMYRLRFWPPSGYVLTVADQGTDDLLDSDADPLTQLTPPFVLLSPQDPARWDAGIRLACFPPDEPLFIANVTLTAQGFPMLQIQDPNQPRQVTGYNIYRSPNKTLPPASWPLLASDVVDMDAGTPNIQWVDSSGDPPPGGIWYYNATAYNHDCPAEGPF